MVLTQLDNNNNNLLLDMFNSNHLLLDMFKFSNDFLLGLFNVFMINAFVGTRHDIPPVT